MRAVRTVPIPIDHAIAEVAAYPLASEQSLRKSVCALDHLLATDDAKGLWRAAERELLGTFPAFSIDEVVAIRDRVWFSQTGETTTPLHRYVERLAREHLRSEGSHLVPAIPSDRGPLTLDADASAQARHAWRWLTFALPADLLIAACDLSETAPARVEYLSPILATCLRDHGYAESHLHFGAALDFSSLWSAVLTSIGDQWLKREKLLSPGAVLGEGIELVPWLLRAALARYCLAVFLDQSSRYTDVRDFARSLCGDVRQMLGVRGGDHLVIALEELASGTLRTPAVPDATMRALYARITRVRQHWRKRSATDVHAGDAIAPIVGYRGPTGPTPEILFVRRGLRYLRAAPADDAFARIFWQCVRVRNIIYRHVTQRPLTPGLQWFMRTYSRLSPLRRPMRTRALLRAASIHGGAGNGLRSLEVRTAPESGPRENLEVLEAVRNSARDLRQLHAGKGTHPIELGLVLHLTKSRGEASRSGRPPAHWRNSEADPSWKRQGFRYARYYLEKRREAYALADLLRVRPGALHLLRGVDVCTDELGVPTWVLAPLVRYLRAAGEQAARHLERLSTRPLDGSSGGWTIEAAPPLRVTVHAGEDFVHLLGGLRRVDEAIHRFELREGDRIGHGVALGVDARAWASSAGRLPVLAEERLLDLVWEWQWYARQHHQHNAERLTLIEHETSRITHDMLNVHLTVAQIDRVIERLHDENMLRRVGFPCGRRPAVDLDPDEQHLQAYLTSRRTFEKGRRVEWIDPRDEGPALAAIQSTLRGEIARRGLTVEINPTSNLLIANLADLQAHPLWRLRPPRGEGDAPPVALCIGSDDPTTFATGLREEFGLLHDALLAAGLSDDEAVRWLNEVRERGLATRFTLASSDVVLKDCLRPVFGLSWSVTRPP